MKINKIIPSQEKYTEILDNIPNPPKQILYRGELPNQRIKTVAIVGSRKPTNYGREVTQRIASELAQRGVVIISGMALGIDGIAHTAALEAGGTTIAVLANGVDKFYPSSHRGLAERILNNNGVILSEYDLGTPALAHQFLERNRIVSGLADIVIIVEAAARSGTLSTATHALEQGKDVFAVPGNITSPLSEGCNKLIKMGAQPLTSTEDIVECLGINKNNQQETLFKGDNDAENAILELLKQGLRDGEEILTRSKLSISEFNQAITMLEIKGLVKSYGGNKWGLG